MRIVSNVQTGETSGCLARPAGGPDAQLAVGRRQFLLGSALLLLCGAAPAHEFHVSICDISFNAKTRNVEFVHAYTLHDFDAAFRTMYGRAIDLSQPADDALLRAYFDKTFVIENSGKSRLPISWVGSSYDAETLTVYQELPRSRLKAGASLQNTVLMDIFPSHSSTVNIRLDGKIRTLRFNRKNQTQRLL